MQIGYHLNKLQKKENGRLFMKQRVVRLPCVLDFSKKPFA